MTAAETWEPGEGPYRCAELGSGRTINYENSIARGDLESFEWCARRGVVVQGEGRGWSFVCLFGGWARGAGGAMCDPGERARLDELGTFWCTLEHEVSRVRPAAVTASSKSWKRAVDGVFCSTARGISTFDRNRPRDSERCRVLSRGVVVRGSPRRGGPGLVSNFGTAAHPGVCRPALCELVDAVACRGGSIASAIGPRPEPRDPTLYPEKSPFLPTP